MLVGFRTCVKGYLRDSWPLLLGIAVVVFAALALRWALIVQPPFTDEGVYEEVAYEMWNRPAEAPPAIWTVAYINLCPRLFAWVCGLGNNYVLHFRMLDAVMLSCSASLLLVLLRKLTRLAVALPLTLLWVLTFSHPLFVNAGFKNPFCFGLIPILGAFLILTRWKGFLPVFAAGACLGVAYMIREPLVMYALPAGLYAMCCARSVRAAIPFGLGAAGMVVTGVATIAFFDGSGPIAAWQHILQNYHDASDMYEALGPDSRFFYNLQQIRDTLNVTLWVAPVWAMGMFLAVRRCVRDRSALPLLLTGIVLALTPLVEFTLKISWPYTLSMAFLGLTWCAALGFAEARWSRRWGVMLAAVLVAMALTPSTVGGTSLAKWHAGLEKAENLGEKFAPFMLRQEWRSPLVDQSLYLHAARTIRENTAPDDEIMVSGCFEVLYPLSERMPDVWLGETDLSRCLCKYGTIPPEKRKRLNERPPKIFVESLGRFSSCDHLGCFDRFKERYALIEEMAPGNNQMHYGLFGYRIWKLK